MKFNFSKIKIRRYRMRIEYLPGVISSDFNVARQLGFAELSNLKSDR